jgi:hypothetical protein
VAAPVVRAFSIALQSNPSQFGAVRLICHRAARFDVTALCYRMASPRPLLRVRLRGVGS